MKRNIEELVSKMTLEEKAGMCSGSDFWRTKGVERIGIPKVMVTDGPHGLRKQEDVSDHLGLNKSVEAVCFPAACSVACSFDRELIEEMGKTLGEACQAEDIAVLLGPAVNIKRSPLCGRNFEYFSEDPYASSEMAASYIKGVQSQNVGTSIKHFAANNQEHRRMTTNSVVDERTLHEIYLASFENAIKKAQPWTVMSAYNKINGDYASENKYLLTDILRELWGFEGFTVTDWGANNDRVKGLAAGLDLEMPSSGGINDKLIVEAVQNGTLSEETLDIAVTRLLTVIFNFVDNKVQDAAYVKQVHHQKAKVIADESIVLLKNENILPLNKNQKITFIGKFAETPRYQGSGSSHINTKGVIGAVEAVKDVNQVTYAQGFDTNEDVIDEKLVKEALEAAASAEVAVVFAGLPDSFESEGFDRKNMNLPKCQNHLIAEICKVQKNIVVVLHNGSPIEIPWINEVKGLLEAYLSGESVGESVVDILFGKVNPSGKLSESFPLQLSDNPSYLNFPGNGDTVPYSEGLYVGYRYYEKKNMNVLFPFGFGLSYTSFEYSDMMLSSESIKDSDTLTVTFKVKNTGNMAGKEVVQLYVADKESTFSRPIKELKEFAKVALNAGEEKEVSFTLEKRSFAYYNPDIKDWHVESGEFEICVGKNSKDIVLTKTVFVESTVELPLHLTLNSTLGDIMSNKKTKAYFDELMKSMSASGPFSQIGNNPDGSGLGGAGNEMMLQMFMGMPIRTMVTFSRGAISMEQILKIIDEMNAL